MYKILTPFIFIAIGFLFIHVTKKNVAGRKKELNDNYSEAITVLQKKLSVLMPNEDVELKQILSLRELEFLKALGEGHINADGSHNYLKAQQGIITIQDIIIKINKIKKQKKLS